MVILSYFLLWHKASGLWARTGCFSSDIICIKQKRASRRFCRFRASTELPMSVSNQVGTSALISPWNIFCIENVGFRGNWF